ncbi:MAG: hypothetical protein EP338_09100 [Bacteroidetes bacterium]|nr:MAG: hypothetical protein EP338_09100 [Bacteroidota bacterium]
MERKIQANEKLVKTPETKGLKTPNDQRIQNTTQRKVQKTADSNVSEQLHRIKSLAAEFKEPKAPDHPGFVQRTSFSVPIVMASTGALSRRLRQERDIGEMNLDQLNWLEQRIGAHRVNMHQFLQQREQGLLSPGQIANAQHWISIFQEISSRRAHLGG